MSNNLSLLDKEHKMSRKKLLKRTLKYIKPERKSFIFAILLILINVTLELLFPLFIKENVRNLQSGNPVLDIIVWLAIGYLLLSILSQAVLYIESIILQKAGQRIVYNLRLEVFSHIENMSQNQLNDIPVGSLVTRVANYTSNLSDLFTNTLVNMLKNILTVVGVYSFMFGVSPRLATTLLIIVAIVFIISFVFSRYIHKQFKLEKTYYSNMNAFLSENISGMKITQLFNQQKRKEKEFLEKNEDIRLVRNKILFAFGIYRPLVSFLYYIAIAITFYSSIKMNLTSDVVVAFYLFLSRFFNPIQNLADELNHIQRATSASEKLFYLLDIKPDVLDEPDAIEVDNFKGEIKFDHVWFSYIENEWILKDVSFTVKPGETCAFVGATGAGKTTILSLLVRNYEPQKGKIYIDGIDIKHIKIQSLRKAIGQMLQDVCIFSGSIKSNITLNNEDYTSEEIQSAIKYVNADTFVNKLKHGIDEEIVERGENLSQGQRQLLSFARTVIHKPQLLILDEATANIDTETESIIQESLSKITNIGTTLVVAHRLSTIQKANNIIVLQNGQIIEQGTHQSLIKEKGYYYKLYKLQFDN